MTRIDLSTLELLPDEGLRTLASFGELVLQHGYLFGLHLHRTASSELIEEVRRLNVPVSIEAPIGADFSINLASDNQPETWEAVEHTVHIAQEMNAGGGKIFVAVGAGHLVGADYSVPALLAQKGFHVSRYDASEN